MSTKERSNPDFVRCYKISIFQISAFFAILAAAATADDAPARVYAAVPVPAYGHAPPVVVADPVYPDVSVSG
jgi:hypothetical protein